MILANLVQLKLVTQCGVGAVRVKIFEVLEVQFSEQPLVKNRIHWQVASLAQQCA